MKAFYQILFQNETLYREPVTVETPSQVVSTTAPQTATKVNPPTPKSPAAPITPTATFAPTPTLNHKVLVLIDENGGMSPSDAIFLRKVLEAVKINPDHVDILNIAGKQMDFRPVLAGKKVHHFISFGVPFIKINLEILMNRYDPKQIAGVNFLLAEPLTVVQSDDNNKRALWNALKAMFFGN